MIFTSFSYLLLFLPAVVITSYFLPANRRHLTILWIIIASMSFYAFWKVEYLLIFISSILFNYTFGIFINNSSNNKRTLLTIGISANIAALAYFKYTGFSIGILNSFFGLEIHIGTITLPLAISFFTFQQIAWLLDQYRNEAHPCTFTEYICAVSFFPHLIAGPIVQYHELIPQFQLSTAFRLNWDFIAKGLFLIGCGTFKKIVIADSLSPYVTLCFDNLKTLNLLQAWLATMAYTMQLYFDFSGYCDIAIGSALLLGIHLPDNFRSPYKSPSIRDFWQRWHITLGKFLTRYLYVPLGGNRGGLMRTCRNILLVMTLSGLWHGAGFGFILWGIAHGTAMVAHRLWSSTGLKIRNRGLSTLLTFLFVSLCWVLFRAQNLDDAFKVFRGLLGMDGIPLPPRFQTLLPASWHIIYADTAPGLFGASTSEMHHLLFALAGSLACTFFGQEAGAVWDNFMRRKSPFSYAISAGSGALLLVAFFKMIAVPHTEFIYFNF